MEVTRMMLWQQCIYSNIYNAHSGWAQRLESEAVHSVAPCYYRFSIIVYVLETSFSGICTQLIYLARSAKLPTRLYILLALISFFLTWDKLSQDLLNQFSRFLFTKWKVFVWIFSIQTSFLIALGTLSKFAKWPLFNTLAFLNGFEYRNFDLEVIKGAICATFCAILVKIGPLTPKITQGVSVPFKTRWQKLTHHTKYLSKYWTEFHQLFSIGRLMYADCDTEIIFAVVEETFL